MGHAFLDTDGDDGFPVRIDIDVEPAAVPVGNRAAQSGDAHGGRIAVVVLFSGGFHHFFDDVGRGGQVGVAHAHIDDILPGPPAFHFQFIDSGENIGRQAV